MCNGCLKRQYYGPEAALLVTDFVQKGWTKFSNSSKFLSSLLQPENIYLHSDWQCGKVDFKGEGNSVGGRVPRAGFEDAMKAKKEKEKKVIASLN